MGRSKPLLRHSLTISASLGAALLCGTIAATTVAQDSGQDQDSSRAAEGKFKDELSNGMPRADTVKRSGQPAADNTPDTTYPGDELANAKGPRPTQGSSFGERARASDAAGNDSDDDGLDDGTIAIGQGEGKKGGKALADVVTSVGGPPPAIPAGPSAAVPTSDPDTAGDGHRDAESPNGGGGAGKAKFKAGKALADTVKKTDGPSSVLALDAASKEPAVAGEIKDDSLSPKNKQPKQ